MPVVGRPDEGWRPSLYERLCSYGEEDYAPFHMPGHKRQARPGILPEGLPWKIDITEIDGFDNLHHAEGILKESMDAAACFYGVKRTLYSVGGSTAGLLSAVFAAAKPGETILMGRNCHKSVYHAVMLRNLCPLYLYPQIDPETGLDCGYQSADLEKLLTENPQIRAVVVTSPTYEGVISDIAAMATSARRRGIPLIVDEAHGAHLTVRGQMAKGICAQTAQTASEDARMPAKEVSAEAFVPSAVALGADLVIQSVHKTLPSLTQTALLHICMGAPDWLGEAAARYMGMFQTSSPSYVLLASIDACIRYLASPQGIRERIGYAVRLRRLRERLRGFRHIRLLEPAAGHRGEGIRQDDSKVLLSAEGMGGKEFYELLRVGYRLQPEMCAGDSVLLMTSLFDSPEMYDRLERALIEIDAGIAQKKFGAKPPKGKGIRRFVCPPGRAACTPAQAEGLPAKTVRLWQSEGCISAEYVYVYPPGIPLLVPGEEISQEALSFLRQAVENGLNLQGLQDLSKERIRICAGSGMS